MAVVSTDGAPGKIHAKNFELITSRWGELWPEFRGVISKLIASYGQESPEGSSIYCVYIDSLSEPIIEGAEWSIGVVFSEVPTLWELPYQGWTPVSDHAQAVY